MLFTGDDEFQFIPVGGEGSDRFLIQAAAENTKCLERVGRDVYLEECNPSDTDQRWYAPRGSVASNKFELSIDGIQCMTTHHHPKKREVIELHDCDSVEAEYSSYWERA